MRGILPSSSVLLGICLPAVMLAAGCSSDTDLPVSPDAAVPPDALIGDAGLCTEDEDCDDGVACTVGACNAGSCVFEAQDVLCADDNDCTTGSCHETEGCLFDDVADDSPCTDGGGNEGLCEGGACIVPCTGDEECDDGNECTAGSCLDDVCVHDPVSEGLACTEGYCSTAGQCVECLDAGHCTDGDNECAEASCADGACVYTLDHDQCDDVNECTTDVCTDDGCTHPPVEDGTPCGSGATSVCEEGICVGCVTGADCADGVDCTLDECTGGVCSNTPDDGECNDDNECTSNTCTSSGCESTDVAEGTECDAGICDGDGACVECTNATHCEDDGVSCTVAVCNDTECDQEPRDEACDDDNECTLNTCDVTDDCQVTNVENGTSCQDGAGTCQEGVCDVPPPDKDVFRVSTVTLEDPNFHTEVCYGPSCLCVNGTGAANTIIQDSIDELELNLVFTFDPLATVQDATAPMELWAADCTSPTSCTAPDDQEPIESTSTFHTSGTCLEPQEGTVHFGSPNTVEAPCWVTEPATFVFDFDGILIPLQDAQAAGRMADADSIVDGLILGFLDQETAEEIIIPEDIDFIGGESLASLLPPLSCNNTEARNTHNGELGWWFHLNFTADRVTEHSGF